MGFGWIGSAGSVALSTLPVPSFYLGDILECRVCNLAYGLRGTGTINGSGTYEFLVTGLEGTGGSGTIRFQIKQGATTIYDSQVGADDTADPTAAVTGAVIVN